MLAYFGVAELVLDHLGWAILALAVSWLSLSCAFGAQSLPCFLWLLQMVCDGDDLMLGMLFELGISGAFLGYACLLVLEQTRRMIHIASTIALWHSVAISG